MEIIVSENPPAGGGGVGGTKTISIPWPNASMFGASNALANFDWSN